MSRREVESGEFGKIAGHRRCRRRVGCFFALNLPDLSEPFTIACGPSERCGQAPNSPAVTSQGEVLAWWPTRHPALVERGGVLGARYFMDLAAVDAATGRRGPLDTGPPAHVWPLETNNLCARTPGGRFCYWRKRFCGTYAFDLQTRRHHQVQVEVRDPDGGVWNAPYFQRDYTGDEGVGLVQPEMMGMLFPIERWVAGADAATLAGYLASAPSCRGDCVWLECLVQAMEAHAPTRWEDVRRPIAR